MNLRLMIPTDITASAIIHLSLLVSLFIFSEVRPFGAVTAESIAVDIVAPQDIPAKAEIATGPEPVPTPKPEPDFTALDKPAAARAPAPAAQPPPPASPPRPAAANAPRLVKPQPQAAPATYRLPEPDLSIKYNVMLGLPPELAPALPSTAAPSGAKTGDPFDAPATEAADVVSSVVAEFRRHLRGCSKLPAALKSTDEVRVKLRVFMAQDGRLAAEPVLIEASASMKGPLLMQGAISALEACQPYAMLPLDRYGEWKVLDLSFTPRDFSGS